MESILRGEGQSKLALCGCGRLHFTYGSVTLHFDHEEFLLFAESVGRLATMVRQPDAGQTHAPSHVPNTNICH